MELFLYRRRRKNIPTVINQNLAYSTILLQRYRVTDKGYETSMTSLNLVTMLI